MGKIRLLVRCASDCSGRPRPANLEPARAELQKEGFDWQTIDECASACGDCTARRRSIVLAARPAGTCPPIILGKRHPTPASAALLRHDQVPPGEWLGEAEGTVFP